jgi:hypothetical protein
VVKNPQSEIRNPKFRLPHCGVFFAAPGLSII